jgi:hypothetical protein
MFLFTLCIVICTLIWNSKLHTNPKFTTLISLITALTIFFTSFSIIIQLYTFNIQQTNEESKIYDTMFTNLYHDSINYFETNPKMNYYYDEIFRPLHYIYKPANERYYTEEQQVTRLILQNLSELIYYFNNDTTLIEADKLIIGTKINRFVGYLVRSPIFVENYKHLKKTLLYPSLKKYIQTNFHI